MAQYIDKSALVAEIERRIKEGEAVVDNVPSSAILGLIQAYKNVISFLDTLEVKEIGVDLGDPKEEPVSEDLEEAANDYAHDLLHDDVFETFKAGAQWQKEQMINNLKNLNKRNDYESKRTNDW